MYAPRFWIGLLALVIVWGSSYALIEIALPALGPLEITLLRITTGLLLMSVVCLLGRIPWPRSRSSIVRLAGVALFGNVLPFLLISWGQTRIDSAAAGVLMAVMPLSVLVFSRLLVPEDPLTRWHWIGFLFGLSGIAVLLAPAIDWPPEGPLVGHLAVLGGACCYGFAAVLARSLPPASVWSSTAVLLAFGAAMLAPVALFGGVDYAGIGANAATLAVVFLGIFSTSLASVLFLFIVRGTSAAFVSNINFLIPLWAVLLGVLLLDEQLPPTIFAALALVLAGIALAQRRPAVP